VAVGQIARGRSGATEAEDPLSRVAYALVLLAVPLVTCNGLRYGESLTYGDIPLALAGALLVVVWLRNGIPRGAAPAGLFVGAMLVTAAGVLALVPAENLDSLWPTLRFSITLAVMPLILMLAATTPRRIGRLIDAWLLGAALNAVVGALDLLHLTTVGLSLTGVDFVTFTDRSVGLTVHPNHLGLVTAMALPMAVGRLGTGGLRGLAAIALVPLLIVGVVESGSRGAIMAAGAGVVLYFVFGASARRARTTVLLFAAPVVAFVILVTALVNHELTGSVAAKRFAGGAGATVSDQARLDTLRESLDAVLGNPLVGSGFSVVRAAHDIYLQVLEAGGVLALVGFITFAAAILRRAWWLARPSRGAPRGVSVLAAGSGAAVCVWLLFGLVGNAIYDRYLYIPVGIVLALGCVHRRGFELAEQPSARPLASPAPPARARAGRPRPQASPRRAADAAAAPTAGSARRATSRPR
jgi:O-antigen ligase